MSINKVMLTGNLTRDPELRATPSGTSVLSFSIAVNDRRKNQQTGEWGDKPNYIDCTMFGTRAEAVSRILTKGAKVAVEGKLQWHQWEKDGQKRSKIDVIVNEIEFLTARSDASGSMPSVQSAPPSGSTSVPPAPSADIYSDEDIPF